MVRRLLPVALALLLSACDFDGALREYCDRRPADCACDSGRCCLQQGAACESGWCCNGLYCDPETKSCITGASPTLTSDAYHAAIGQAPVGEARGHTFTITNHGEVATTPLAVDRLAGTEFTAEGSCRGAVLEPGASCEVVVTYLPAHLGLATATFEVSERTERLQLSASGASGYPVSLDVRGTGVGSVVSDPPGLDCPTARCSGYLPGGVELKIIPVFDAGTSFDGFGGDCGGGNCTFTLDGPRELSATFTAWLRLEVLQRPGALGAIKVVDLGTACNGACEVVAAGPNTLRPVSQSHSFIGWSGACADAGLGDCALDLQGPTVVGAEFVPYNQMFATQVFRLEEIGPDLSGADRACAENAASLRLAGRYRAYLAAPGIAAASRFEGASGWRSFSTGEALLDRVEELEAGQLLRALVSSSFGEVAIASGGSGGEDETCGGWRDRTRTFTGGSVGAAGRTWGDDPFRPAPNRCDGSALVLCLGIDHPARVARLRPTTRPSFLSRAWSVGGGVEAADQHCTAEAADAGYPGSYFADLVSSARPYAGPPFVRVDGVGGTPADLRLPLNLTLEGEYLTAPFELDAGTRVWTGGSGGVTARADWSCADWTDPAGTALAGRPELAMPGARAPADGGVIPCALPQRLYCHPR